MIEPTKCIFFRSYFVQYDTSQLKILHGYAEGKHCQYSSQRSLCYEAKKRIFDESLVVMLFEFLIVLGCWTLASKFDSFDLILFARCKQSGSMNGFAGLFSFFSLCIYRRTIEFKELAIVS